MRFHQHATEVTFDAIVLGVNVQTAIGAEDLVEIDLGVFADDIDVKFEEPAETLGTLEARDGEHILTEIAVETIRSSDPASVSLP